MRIGIRAHDVSADHFEELVAEIARQGFHCCQLAPGKAIREFNTEKTALTPGMAMYLHEVFARNHVDVAVLGCYLNLAHPDPQCLADIIDTYKRHIRFAAWLGCGLVGTETGAYNASYEFEPFCHTEEALEIFIRNLRTVVGYAEKMGVVVGIEPVCRHIVNNAVRTRRVLDAIHSPNLQVIFDPVNLLNRENYLNREQIFGEFMELVGDEIAAIHAKDFRITQTGEMEFVPCGFGEMDYRSILSYVKHHKPYIHILLEETKPANAISARLNIEEKFLNI